MDDSESREPSVPDAEIEARPPQLDYTKLMFCIVTLGFSWVIFIGFVRIARALVPAVIGE